MAGSATITYSVGNVCGFSGAYKPISIAAFRAPASTGTTYTDRTGAATIGTRAATIPVVESSTTTTSQAATSIAPAQTSLPVEVRIIPNPNKGSFTIEGTTGTLNDGEVSVEIVNILGQVIYKNNVMAQKGNIAAQVQLDSNPPNGTYMLNMKTATGSKVFHFVIRN
jgi:hypothetical protein